jgi:hypothetical protein
MPMRILSKAKTVGGLIEAIVAIRRTKQTFCQRIVLARWAFFLGYLCIVFFLSGQLADYIVAAISSNGDDELKFNPTCRLGVMRGVI